MSDLVYGHAYRWQVDADGCGRGFVGGDDKEGRDSVDSRKGEL